LRLAEDGIVHAGIVERNLQSGHEREVYSTSGFRIRWTQLSPDGRWLAFGMGNPVEQVLMVVHTGTGEVRRLASIDGEDHSLVPHSWSPDGSRLLGAHRSEDERAMVLHVEHLEGAPVSTVGLVNTPGVPGTAAIAAIDWSADGRRIAFMTRTVGQQGWLIEDVIRARLPASGRGTELYWNRARPPTRPPT
jgi:hypothetical protein